jgi:outer membrane protein assembly factor BamB
MSPSTPRRLCLCHVLLLLPFLSSSLLAQPWPRFRGPNGDGISQCTTIPATWTAQDYRWKVTLPGAGQSSPVIWGQRVFITSSIDRDATEILTCLRASDGETLWRKQFSSSTHHKHNLNDYASSTPALDAKRVYMTWTTPQSYTVVALDQEHGDERWRRDLGPFVSEHGSGASPIVFEDLVILVNDQDGPSSVIALDCTTGKTRWEAPRRTLKTGYSTPCLYQPQGGQPQLILSSWAHGLTGLDPRTGKTIWDLGVFQFRVVGSPIVASGRIVASAGTGGVGKRLVAAQPGRPDQGIEAKVAYEVTGSLPYVPTSITNGDLLFLWYDHGVVTCLDAPTGKIHWRERVGGDYFSSPIRVADRLYNVSRDGKVIVLAASKEFHRLGEIDLGEATKSTLAVADGTLYLRTLSHLMALRGGGVNGGK